MSPMKAQMWLITHCIVIESVCASSLIKKRKIPDDYYEVVNSQANPGKRLTTENSVENVIPVESSGHTDNSDESLLIESYVRTNRDAIDAYLSPGFANFDSQGNLRMQPSLVRLRVPIELVPGWIFGSIRPVVQVHLSSLIGQSRSSTVWSIQNHPLYVMKYHAACPDEYKNQDGTPVDSTLVEAYFLTLLAGSGLTNELLYFSNGIEPSLDTEAASGSVKVKLSYCKSSSANQISPPMVRYIITTRVGRTIGSLITRGEGDTPPFYASGKVPFAQSILFGMQLFEMIEELHEKYSLVHGDLHLENVSLDYEPDGEIDETSDLKFIDWGRAVVFNKREIENAEPMDYSFDPEKDNPKSIMCHGIVTYWETFTKNRHAIPTFRDEAMRLLLMIATMIHGYSLAHAMAGMCGRSPKDAELVAEYLRFKNEANFFDCEIVDPVTQKTKSFSLSSVVTDNEDYPIEDKTVIGRVRSKFAEMLARVRGLGPTDKPDYDRLIALLDQIYDLLQPHI